VGFWIFHLSEYVLYDHITTIMHIFVA